jgi:hypothetical protein
MSVPLDALDVEPNRVQPVDRAVSPRALGRQRTALTATRNCVFYAIEALALDLEILNRCTPAAHDLQVIVDDLPDLLAGEQDHGAPSFPVDCSEAISAAPSDGLLDLHLEMVSSDLGDPSVTRSLSVRMHARRRTLVERKQRLENEITQTKKELIRQYAAGIASAEDWLD